MQILNGPVEVGLRTVILLKQAFPAALDLSRIVILDYCIVHSGLAGGPTSILPNRSNSHGEIGIKRGLVEDGLRIMRTAGLVQVQVNTAGIFYKASEDATGFLKLMEAPIVHELESRAAWALERFADSSEEELHRFVLGSPETMNTEIEDPRGSNE